MRHSIHDLSRGPVWLRLFALASICLLFLSAVPVEARTYTVAVVQDGPSVEGELVDRIEAELDQFVSVDRTIRFKRDAAFDAGWDLTRVPSAVQAALDDPEVDLILGIGSLVTYEAARPELTLTKPFVSTFVQRADVLRLPYSEEGRSLEKNLSFMVIPQRAERDLETFRELVPFERLHVAVTAQDLEYADGVLRERLQEYAQELGFRLVAVPVTDDVEASLAGFGSDVEAVYLTRLARLQPQARARFIEGLTARRVPTFSMIGHADVELGALAGLAPDTSEQVVRRAALNLSRLTRGDSTADLPVALSVDSRLMINGKTARVVGYSPSPSIWTLASILDREALRGAMESLTYEEALAAAASANTALAVKDSEVEGVKHDVLRVRSPLLPQILGAVSYLDSDTPLPELQGLVPESGVIAAVALSQSIYDDRLWTLYRASQHLADLSEHEREALRLDVLQDAGTTFLGLGLTRALYRIQASNVELTEDFLDLAKLRVEVGITGQEDVLFWESLLARQKGELFTATQRVRTAQTVLNQIMAVEQSRSWRTDDLTGEWQSFFEMTERLVPAFEDLDSVARFRGVAAEIAVRNAPEIAALDEAIAAQQLRLRNTKRSYWLPSFSASFSYLNELSGDEINLPGFEDEFWILAVSARYPLFRGGLRRANKNEAESALEELENQRRLAGEQIELNTRIVLETAEGIHPRIGLSRSAAEAARENLRIVRDQYAEGARSITDLLSAQNNLFVAEELTATAVYQFLIEIVKLQRAMAWFEHDHGAEERDELFRELEARLAGSHGEPATEETR